MDYYGYFWGLLKYYLPIILFIISIFVEPNVVLLVISIAWIMTSLFVSIMIWEPSNKEKHYGSR